MNDEDAKALINFVGMLLAYIYELPAMVPGIENSENGDTQDK